MQPSVISSNLKKETHLIGKKFKRWFVLPPPDRFL